MVAVADDIRRLAALDFDVPLVEVWVGGAILEPVDRIATYDVALVLDEPPDEVTWLALHPAGSWIADRLRLTKVTAAWFLRSSAHPVHNHRLRALLRVWTIDGAERQAIDRLRRGELTATDIVTAPGEPQLAIQLRSELAQCRRHLAIVLDRYHDRDWRRDHKGFAIYPEDHLWCAAHAVRELTDAVDDLEL